MEIKIKLSNTEHKDLLSYCNLNDLLISEVAKKSFTTGFNIERYGLLNPGGNQEKEVIKEVVVEKRVEIPVEVIKEIVQVEYVEVPVEKIVEVVKEVIIEGGDKSKLDALQSTVMKLRQETLDKDKKLKEYEQTIQDIQKFQEDKKAVYLSGSNLNKTL